MASFNTFKPKPLNALLAAQFLSAFVDNMILFITVAIIARNEYPGYYLPLVQSSFLFSYIIFAPWVGKFADKNAKSYVLMLGNTLKATGILLFILNINPVLSYAVVGVGAVVYSPAKYGILPELTSGEDELLKANSKIETFTILAILCGSVAGGFLSDKSILLSLITCLVLYGLSLLFNTLIPKKESNMVINYSDAIREFKADSYGLFINKHGLFSLIGTGTFWLASAVLRIIIISWIPLTLGISDNTSISLIVAVTGIGLALGTTITPCLVTVKSYTRSVYYGLAMACCIFSFTIIESLSMTIMFLLLIGCLGGIFIVPMNTCLQKVGHSTIGTGKTIAIQNFVENTFMFIGVGAYTLATKAGIGINTSIIATTISLILLLTFVILSRLRENLYSIKDIEGRVGE